MAGSGPGHDEIILCRCPPKIEKRSANGYARGMDDAPPSGGGVAREILVGRARTLAPKFRGRAQAAEQARRVPPETVADIVEAGVHRTCQPRRFGGYELDWTALCETIMTLAEGDASQAWVANVYGEHNCYVSLFPERAQADVWGEAPDALVSSSYAPTGSAVEVEGGYRLAGTWGFSSGVHYAQWALLGAMAERGGARDDHLSLFLVPAAERHIVDDWETMGMAATGSCSVRLEDVFVPGHRALDERLVWRGETPGGRLHAGHVYRMPQRGVAQLALASVPVGAAAGAVRDFEERLASGEAMGRPLKESQALQLRLADASAGAEAARRMVLGTAGRIMDKLRDGGATDNDDIACAMRDGAYACTLARRAVDTIFEAAGGGGARTGSHLQRTLRDVHAASNHIALGWDLAGSLFGRIRLGLEAPIV